MTLNARLLEQARTAGLKLADAERQVEGARSEYHAIVRRMHLAGASLREIAQSLELSHQRVQQMVNSAGGTWWHRIWRSRNATRDLSCTFCGRPENQVSRLIAGPAVFICDACVAHAEQAVNSSSPSTGDGSLVLAGPSAKASCSFCRKRSAVDRPTITSASANLCKPCLDACRQILVDSAP